MSGRDRRLRRVRRQVIDAAGAVIDQLDAIDPEVRGECLGRAELLDLLGTLSQLRDKLQHYDVALYDVVHYLAERDRKAAADGGA